MIYELEEIEVITQTEKENAIQFDRGKIHLKEKSELGEVLEHLNRDVAEDQTGMSSIDMRANLATGELESILVIDTLARLNVLPQDTAWLTRQKKRLSKSKNGIGNKQIVEIATLKRENDMNSSKSSSVNEIAIEKQGMK